MRMYVMRTVGCSASAYSVLFHIYVNTMAGYGWFIHSVHSRNLLCVRNNLLNFCHNVSKTASTTKNVLALKPRKPPTAFLLYVRSIKPKLMLEEPSLKSSEIIKKASKEWSKLEPIQKEHFKNQYTHSYEAYLQRLKEFDDSLTKEERQILQQQIKEYQQTHHENNRRQKIQTFGKPKRPVGAFILYLNSRRTEKDANISNQDWIGRMTSIWKGMSDAEKKPYMSQAIASMIQYQKDIEQWEKDMIKLGHLEIVRRKTLNKHKD